MTKWGWGLVLAGAVSASAAQASDYGDIFENAKTRIAGRAVTAIVDDHNSLFTNPAGLAQIEEWALRLPELIQARAALDITTVIDAFKGLSGTTTGFGSILARVDGKAVGLGVDVLGIGWYRKGMGIHLNVLNTDMRMRVLAPSALYARTKLRLTADSGLSLGYAHSFWENKIRVGIALRPFMIRAGMDTTLDGADLTQLTSSNPTTLLENLRSRVGLGWGFDADLGMQFNWDPLWEIGLKPMFGMSLNNIFAADFKNKLGSASDRFTGNAPALQRKLNVGMAASLTNLVSWFEPVVSVEFRELGVATSDFLEHFAAVAKGTFKPLDWFQGSGFVHFYRGQIGGGVTGKLWKGELTLGTWAENLGNGTGVGTARIYTAALAAQW